jgi:hypothetical protein
MGWIAGAVSIGSSIIGAMGKADASDQKNQMDQNTSWGDQELKNTGQLENTQLQAQEAYYYQQLNSQQAERGLDQFAKFSKVGQFAPSYTNTNPTPIIVPNAPTIPQQQAPTGLPGMPSGSGIGGLLAGIVGGIGGGLAGNIGGGAGGGSGAFTLPDGSPGGGPI